MTAWLQGLPQPELPALPGRRHAAKPERRDEAAAEWERLHRKTTSPSSAWTWGVSKSHEVSR